ncbi:MAG: hypothetical protein JO051_11175 [Acidobacteriaceae bacterium]|nr:hypothetical protein [Acidobacteriaceae bacterium]
MSYLDFPADEPNHNPSHGGGPRTDEGKARSSMNALKTGLTGRTVLLPTDDIALYEQHLQQFEDDLQPLGPRETRLVQMLADHDWRLIRIANMEMTIYAAGADEFDGWFDHRPAEMRPHLLQLQTYTHYEKQLANLHLQEMRIRRHIEKDTARLQQLQKERGIEPGGTAEEHPDTLVIINSATREVIQTIPMRMTEDVGPQNRSADLRPVAPGVRFFNSETPDPKLDDPQCVPRVA